MSVILCKNFKEPPVERKEVLRYAGCRAAEPEVAALLNACLKETLPKLSYRVCYREFEIEITENCCHFGPFQLVSKQLAKNLEGCRKAVIFAATVGIELDRLIAKYGRILPSKGLMLQALGAERIESLCNVFCAELEKAYNMPVRPRFSPGYGDLPLQSQAQLFTQLDCERKIGLTLNSSLLMSPSKSVTAIVGVGCKAENTPHKCSTCSMKHCSFRG